MMYIMTLIKVKLYKMEWVKHPISVLAAMECIRELRLCFAAITPLKSQAYKRDSSFTPITSFLA